MMNSSEVTRDIGRADASRFAHARGFARLYLLMVAARSDPLIVPVWAAVTTACGVILFLAYRGMAGWGS